MASLISPNVKDDAAMNLADVEVIHSTSYVPRDGEHGYDMHSLLCAHGGGTSL